VPLTTSGKAGWALGLGLASLCLVVPAIPALILGILALRDIGKSNDELGGRGLAITGIVLSCLSFILIAPIALLLPAISRVRESAARMQDANNLKQIGLAFYSVSSSHGDRLPRAAAFRSATGKPLLSWRVAILPYIEQDALYKQFRLDEPWDSPHNIQFVSRMPKTYLVPGQQDDRSGRTHYQVFVGPGTLFEEPKDNGNPGNRMLQFGVRFPADVPDGTANTILVTTARTPVPWTSPQDLPFEPDGPLPPMNDQFSAGFNVLFADGTVRPLRPNIPVDVLRAMITRNGGEAVREP